MLVFIFSVWLDRHQSAHHDLDLPPPQHHLSKSAPGFTLVLQQHVLLSYAAGVWQSKSSYFAPQQQYVFFSVFLFVLAERVCELFTFIFLINKMCTTKVPFYSCSYVKCWCFRITYISVSMQKVHVNHKCLQSPMKSCCFLTCTLIYCSATAAGSTSALQWLKRCSASQKPVGKVQRLCNDPAVARAQSCTPSS